MRYNDPAAAAGSSATHPFYLVQAYSLDAAATVIGASNRAGEFTFDLTPGAK